MLHLLRLSSFFINPIFRKRLLEGKEDLFLFEIPLSLNTTPSIPSTTSQIPITQENQIPQNEPESVTRENQSPKNELESLILRAYNFLKCTRRKILDLDPKQIQESEAGVENEVSFDDFVLFDIDIPVALRKGMRECIKHPLYPTSTLYHLAGGLNAVSISYTLS